VADSGAEQSPEGEGRFEGRIPGPLDAEKSEGRWETGRKEDRHNDKRATASETACGCIGGEKLWREKPQAWIQHAIRLADMGRMKASGG
jgi:hypothetical protein